MGDNKKNKNRIVIKSFIGPEDEGKHLVGCYYMPKPDDTYDFFDKGNKVKRRDVILGKQFSFELDLHVYHLTLDTIPDGYGGPWSTNPGPDPGLAEGTYQAEAGGSEEEEEPSAASAGACS